MIQGEGPDACVTTTMGGGSMLSLVLQLCSVELQMCLHDQPSDTPMSSAHRGVLPACCTLLEEALFRLHTDCDEEEGEDEGDAAGDVATFGLDPWLSALADAQVLSAQQAFQRAVMVCLEYLEAVRSEQATEKAAAGPKDAHVGRLADVAPVTAKHPLLPPVARLVSAWLAQPSAPTMMELYDRACSMLPLLRAVAAQEPSAAWAGHLNGFERAEREPPPDGLDGEQDASAAGGEQETMAQLFERLMPHAQRGKGQVV